MYKKKSAHGQNEPHIWPDTKNARCAGVCKPVTPRLTFSFHLIKQMKYYLLYLKTKKKCRLMRRLLVKIPAIEDLWKVQVRILESNFILFFCHEKHLRITSKLKKLIFNVKIFFNWLRNLKLNQIKKYLSPSLFFLQDKNLKNFNSARFIE